jgi:hypothetical protein
MFVCYLCRCELLKVGPVMWVCLSVLQRWWAPADCPVLPVTEWGRCSSGAPQSSADHGCYWPRTAWGIRSHDTVRKGTNVRLVEQIVFPLSRMSSQSHITTDSQSASPSWCQAPIWDPRPISLSPWDFLEDSYCLLSCSALSDERTGL